MIPDSFLAQATTQATFQENHGYIPSSDTYPSAFAAGYVRYDKVPKNLIPSYYVARYAPDINNERVAVEYPNLQSDVFDIMYLGYNQAISKNMNGNDVIVGSSIYYNVKSNSISYMGSNIIYGEFDPLGVTHPSQIYLSIKFTGIASGTVNLAYAAIYGENFTVPQFIALRDGTLTKTFTHAGKTYDVLSDMSSGVLWRDDEDATGFYFLEYAFVGWGRNTTAVGGIGSYSYLYPALGAALTTPSDVTYLEPATRLPKWLLTGAYGSFPYGGFRRSSWGTGLRTRGTNTSLCTGIYYEETGTQMIFECSMTSASYASFFSHGYVGNYSGFNASTPILTGANSVVSTWTLEALRAYHDKWSDNQRNFFVPEGRSDFGTTVPLVTLDDVWHHMCLVPVWATPNHEYEYAQKTSDFWFAEMNGFEFVGNLVQGDDQDIAEKVPSWILDGDSTKSTYNPDSDRPVPTPPSDDGEDDTRRRNDNTDLPGFDGIRLVSGTGFSTFYSLSSYHVAALGTYLSQMPASFWEALGTATDYKMANVLDYIVSLKWYPLNLQASAPSLYPDVETSTVQFGFTGTTAITLGDIGTSYKLGTVNRIFDFGTLYIPYKDGVKSTFLDYEPYTDVFANFPFIGKVQLHANQIVGYRVSCHYVVDLITGMCTCFLDNGFDTVFEGAGKIGVDITVFGNDVITQSERLTAGYIGTASHMINSSLSIGASAKASDVVGIVGGATSAVSGLVADTVQVANAKRGVPQSVGGGSGFGSTYCDPYPCIIVSRPAVKIPSGYGHQSGYVSNTRVTLGSLTGFTVCDNPDLAGVTATATEKAMITELLQTGVYL